MSSRLSAHTSMRKLYLKVTINYPNSFKANSLRVYNTASVRAGPHGRRKWAKLQIYCFDKIQQKKKKMIKECAHFKSLQGRNGSFQFVSQLCIPTRKSRAAGQGRRDTTAGNISYKLFKTSLREKTHLKRNGKCQYPTKPTVPTVHTRTIRRKKKYIPTSKN